MLGFTSPRALLSTYMIVETCYELLRQGATQNVNWTRIISPVCCIRLPPQHEDLGDSISLVLVVVIAQAKALFK